MTLYLSFCMPLDIYFHPPFHSIFPLYSVQFPSSSVFHFISCSSPYSMPHFIQVSSATSFHFTPLCITFKTHFSIPYYLTLQVPFHSVLCRISSCSSIPLNLSFHFVKIVITVTSRRDTCQCFYQRIRNVSGLIPRISTSGNLSITRINLGYEQILVRRM